MKKIAEAVPLKLNINNPLHYYIPENLKIKIGQLVVVSLGTRFQTAVVTDIINKSPYAEKEITHKVSEKVFLNKKHIEFLKWVSFYYKCPFNLTVSAALPQQIEEVIDFDIKILNRESLTPKQKEVIDLILINNKLNALKKELKNMNIFNALIKNKKVSLIPVFSPPKIKEIFETYYEFLSFPEKLTVRQKEVLLEIKTAFDPFKLSEASLFKTTPSMIKKLHSMGALSRAEKKKETTIDIKEYHPRADIILTAAQKNILNEIKKKFKLNKPVLLKGVTASGKTEIYVNLIRDVLKEDAQALVLVPEIVLAFQLYSYFCMKFKKEDIGIYTSALGLKERYDNYTGVFEGGKKIIIGTRLASLIPFKNLKLIIVDEEYSFNFKQEEIKPYYNARDISVYRAKKESINIVLVTATPSIETYNNVSAGKYEAVYLNERPFEDYKDPEVILIDLKKEHLKNNVAGSMSFKLINSMREVLSQNKQVILFHNRRGYFTSLVCLTCGFVFECEDCSISLSYHKPLAKFKCHICSKTYESFYECPQCSSKGLKLVGSGTQKIQDEIHTFFPDKKIKILDLDFIRTKQDYVDVLKSMHDKEIDILIGTQIVVKGLDFPEVALIGVINADFELLMPDYKGSEICFSNIVQVTGRAGRRGGKAKVYIQTYRSNHYAIKAALKNDFESFLKMEMDNRERYSYPPFSKLALISYETFLKDDLMSFLVREHKLLSAVNSKLNLNCSILPPQRSFYFKKRKVFRYQILVKCFDHISRSKLIDAYLKNTRFKKGKIKINIDPLNLL